MALLRVQADVSGADERNRDRAGRPRRCGNVVDPAGLPSTYWCSASRASRSLPGFLRMENLLRCRISAGPATSEATDYQSRRARIVNLPGVL